MSGRLHTDGMGASPARVAILVAALALVGIAPAARATEAYARQTGKGCADCHASAQGGALSPAGEAFKANGYKLPKGGEPQQQTP